MANMFNKFVERGGRSNEGFALFQQSLCALVKNFNSVVDGDRLIPCKCSIGATSCLCHYYLSGGLVDKKMDWMGLIGAVWLLF
jgi:hypothetical protein